jgi:hypothetical protein
MLNKRWGKLKGQFSKNLLRHNINDNWYIMLVLVQHLHVSLEFIMSTRWMSRVEQKLITFPNQQISSSF